MNPRAIRRLLRTRSSDIEDFAAKVADLRARPLELRTFQEDLDGITAVWAARPQRDLILYRATLPDPSTAIAHELAHMLLGHDPILIPGRAAPVRLRHDYADAEEADAEHLATLIALSLGTARPEQALLGRLI